MVPVISAPGLKTAMNYYLKLPVGLRSAVANLKASSERWRPNSAQLQESREQAAEQASISYVLEHLGPAEVERL